MVSRRILLCVLSLLVFGLDGAGAYAEEAKPGAPEPGVADGDGAGGREVAPSAEQSNADSPKVAIGALFRAISTGDAAGVSRRVHAAARGQTDLPRALAAAAGAVGKVRKAAVAKFGAEAERALDFDLAPPSTIAAAEQAIDGDSGSVKFVLEPGVIEIKVPFEKKDGVWKVSVARWAEDEEAGIDVDGMTATARSAAENVTKLADRVAAGDFKTIDAVRKTLEATLLPRAASVEIGPDGEARPVEAGDEGEFVEEDEPAPRRGRRPADAAPGNR